MSNNEKKEQRRVTFDQAAQNLVNFRSNLLALATRPLQRLAMFQEEWQQARARAESAQSLDHHDSQQISAAEIIEELLKLPPEELAKFGLQKLQEQEQEQEQEEPNSDQKFRTPSSVAGGSGVSPVLNRSYLQEKEASRLRRPKNASMIA